MASKNNIDLLGNLMSGLSAQDLTKVEVSDDMFTRMALPACFKQCNPSPDLVKMEDMECTYLCVLTYRDAFNELKQFRD
eukprot:CAMPEP_0168625526 /NCGR_PEP_ID=MMETSP0449_2-20121227/10068_1 /TAXON_ID=1082188 /ORGANISM="Strombidium rassoulzadegani, Strain ras09" /LENGTH=78 /DNA_ID=CAMNT_0008667305 /DNA_START=8 /DNA_END=244 /DNA_ORIENTATION=+